MVAGLDAEVFCARFGTLGVLVTLGARPGYWRHMVLAFPKPIHGGFNDCDMGSVAHHSGTADMSRVSPEEL